MRARCVVVLSSFGIFIGCYIVQTKRRFALCRAAEAKKQAEEELKQAWWYKYLPQPPPEKPDVDFSAPEEVCTSTVKILSPPSKKKLLHLFF
jgi:hypothetical protein